MCSFQSILVLQVYKRRTYGKIISIVKSILLTTIKMMKIFFVLFTISLTCFVRSEVSKFNIIGGDAVTENLLKTVFNYHVAVKSYESEAVCNGAIVYRDRVVTAAHCIARYDPNSLYVRAGSLNASFDGIVRNVSIAIIHSSYQIPTQYDNDIAVLLFDEPFEFGPTIGPIRIANSKDDYIYEKLGTNVTGAGFGASEYSNHESLLRYIDLPIVNHTMCAEDYLPDVVTENMFCVGNESFRFFAQGDSGGDFS